MNLHASVKTDRKADRDCGPIRDRLKGGSVRLGEGMASDMEVEFRGGG